MKHRLHEIVTFSWVRLVTISHQNHVHYEFYCEFEHDNVSVWQHSQGSQIEKNINHAYTHADKDCDTHIDKNHELRWLCIRHVGGGQPDVELRNVSLKRYLAKEGVVGNVHAAQCWGDVAKNDEQRQRNPRGVRMHGVVLQLWQTVYVLVVDSPQHRARCNTNNTCHWTHNHAILLSAVAAFIPPSGTGVNSIHGQIRRTQPQHLQVWIVPHAAEDAIFY